MDSKYRKMFGALLALNYGAVTGNSKKKKLVSTMGKTSNERNVRRRNGNCELTQKIETRKNEKEVSMIELDVRTSIPISSYEFSMETIKRNSNPLPRFWGWNQGGLVAKGRPSSLMQSLVDWSKSVKGVMK